MPLPLSPPRCAACRRRIAVPGDTLCRACAAELVEAIRLLEVGRE